MGHVLITGASAGLGRAAAVAFAGRGARVTLLARDERRLGQAADDVRAAGGAALPIAVDVADAEAVEAAATRAEAEQGEIDTWVNSAMATVFAPIGEISASEYRRVTEVTYLGQVYGTMSALRRMRSRNRGTIVNVGSALAYHGLPLQAAYCGAKFAVRGFSEAVFDELLHEGSAVRLSLVVMPALNTPQFDWARSYLPKRLRPVPPVFEPEAAAAAVLHAANAAPKELVVGTSSLQLLLGSVVAPRLVDRILAKRGVSGQQTDEAAEPLRGNLFDPVPGDFSAHGRFDDEASPTVRMVSMATVRGVFGVLGVASLVAAIAVGALLTA